ncbi:hypothetical protein CISIN_1g045560mg [Citrus sinensis]|uniref:Uncharacterized protein n=1 Tax=Citrus sinensis TaxID=2711 RepID=A0A067GGW4_CITSI|nr:hypothetical protein CISIN_1g045560mg [Citrus sinensis]
MSHRKIQSQGSIPFSWEDKPGVSKITTPQECSLNQGLHALNLESPSPPPQPPRTASSNPNSLSLSAEEILKIPLPPCPSQQPPRRTTSSKGVIGWWQEDPFLAAYMECTKSSGSRQRKNSNPSCVGSKPKKKSKFLFSCKGSCETHDDNFVRLSNLPPLPKERIRTLR